MFKQNAMKPLLLLAMLYLMANSQKNVPSDKTSGASTAKTTQAVEKVQLRGKIIDFAKKYEKISYKYGGTTPKGFDCSGFTLFVMNEFGIKLPHNSAAQSKKGKKVKIKKAQPGDLLFFANKKGINHVALIISNTKDELKIIHSSSKRGIVIDEVYKNSYWNPRLKFAKNVID